VVVAGRRREPDVFAVHAVWRTERQTLEHRRAGPGGAALQLVVDGQIVVDAAEKTVVAERELVAGNQLAAAGDAPEAVDVVDVAARAHHQVGDAEAELTAGAFRSEQPIYVKRTSRNRHATTVSKLTGVSALSFFEVVSHLHVVFMICTSLFYAFVCIKAVIEWNNNLGGPN